STSISVTTAGDTIPPSAPTDLAGSAASATTITLTWTASTDNVGVTSYRVSRNGVQIGTSFTAGYSDTGLLPSISYTYSVVAVDAAANVSAPSTSVSVTTVSDTVPPSAPTGLAGSAASSNSISLTWIASSDNVAVTGYRILRNGQPIGTSTAVSYSDSGLAASTDYTYAVVALDAAGNASEPSASIVVTTPGSGLPPTVLAVDNFNRVDGQLGSNWTVIDSAPVIVNQHVQEVVTSDGNDSIPIYTGATWPADHYS